MSLADWTTFRVRAAKGSDMQADDDSGVSGSDSPKGGSTQPMEAQSFVGSRVGAYLITKRLGAGGVGEVFKGVDVMLKREVAIKVLRDELASDPLFLKRFSNEAQLHAKLNHPNVASVHAFLHEGDKQLMVMEYVPGISLDEFVRAGGPIPVERALEHLSQGARRHRARAHPRHRAPRHQAGQHHVGRQRPGEGDGLRHRTRDGQPGAPDAPRPCSGHCEGDVARTDSRQDRPTCAPTSIRWASCCTRCWPAVRPSTAATTWN